MEATFCKKLAFAAVVMALALAIGSGVAWAQVSQPKTQPVFQFTYFANARQILDGKVRIVNGGSAATVDAVSPDGDLCAFIYVFYRERISECCGCLVSANGGLELSINKDLTGNPVSGPPLTKGVIKIVSATPNTATCDPDELLPPSSTSCPGQNCATPKLGAWVTHVQVQLPNLSFPASEEEFLPDTLSDAEAGALASGCAAIGTVGGTKGICSCGIAQ